MISDHPYDYIAFICVSIGELRGFDSRGLAEKNIELAVRIELVSKG